MARKRQMVIEFLVDSDQADRKLRGVQGSVQMTGRSFDRMATVVKGALTVGTATAVARFGADMATLSVQGDAMRKRFDTVFQGVTDSMRQWVDAQNEAFGVSEVALEGMAAAVGDLLVPMGMSRDAAAGLTQTILSAGNALSEWSSGAIDAEDATTRITKAMLGERDGLVPLGIKLSEAEVAQKALEVAQRDGTSATDQQTRALATLELVLAKSADALAAYEDRSEESISTTKELAARWADLRQQAADTLGPPLLTAAESGLGGLDALFKGLTDSSDRFALSVSDSTTAKLAEAIGVFDRASYQANILNENLKDGAASAGLAAAEYTILSGEMNANADSSTSLTAATETLSGAIDAMAAFTVYATDAQHNLNSARLEALDPLANLMGALDRYRTAEAAVLEQIQAGQQGTDEYADAMIDLAQRRGELNAAELRYADEGGQASLDALSALLAQSGATRQEIDRLIEQIKRLNATPVRRISITSGRGAGAGSGPSGGPAGGGVLQGIGNAANGATVVVQAVVDNRVLAEATVAAAELNRRLGVA